MSYAARGLGFNYGLSEVSFDLPATGLVAIAGPNGAGKSTLMRILAGVDGPYRGSAQFEAREIRQWPRREFARRVAFLPQSVHVQFPFTAREVVLMGRTPLARGWFESPADRSAAAAAMVTTGTAEFAERDFRSLSAGECQRVLLASALAQNPRALLLDEPATFLDVRHQLASYRVLAELSRSMLVIAVTHDLNLALHVADRVLLLDRGRVHAEGAPREVLSAANLKTVFGVDAQFVRDGRGRSWIVYEQ
jgi:iron complex transport system ATP-binding protein